MSHSFPLIIADESVGARIINHLVIHGYSVFSITKENPGITDSQVIEIANEMNAFIITEDKDFGDELVYRRVGQVSSMLLRISDLPIGDRIRLVIETFASHGNEMDNCFSVLTSKKLRIRRYSN